MTRHTIISIGLAVVVLVGAVLLTNAYVSEARNRRELSFKRRVSIALWGGALVFIVLPVGLAYKGILRKGFAWASVYGVLFLSLPVLYYVEKRRADLRGEEEKKTNQAKQYLNRCLIMFGCAFVSSLPIAYMHVTGTEFSQWLEIGVAVVLIVLLHVSNRLRREYVRRQYGEESERSDPATERTEES